MNITDLTDIVADVPTMSGDPLSEILAPSEIRAIAEAVIACGMHEVASSNQFQVLPHLAWMAAVPPHMHDCFSG